MGAVWPAGVLLQDNIIGSQTEEYLHISFILKLNSSGKVRKKKIPSKSRLKCQQSKLKPVGSIEITQNATPCLFGHFCSLTAQAGCSQFISSMFWIFVHPLPLFSAQSCMQKNHAGTEGLTGKLSLLIQGLKPPSRSAFSSSQIQKKIGNTRICMMI